MAAPMDPETEKGCSHYKRKCALVAPCCSKVYPCRICHDDDESHLIDRRAVIEVKCLCCDTQQAVADTCKKCEVKFGFYSCLICRLFDDTDKQQYHCLDCGICRIGGRENFFHCEKCNLCLGIALKGSHKCVENSSHSNCPVCLEHLHTSREKQTVLPCGHLIHSSCMREMLKTWNYACPICSESMVDMKNIWSSLDDEVANTPMPEEYKNFNVQVLCRDCHKESKVAFHVIGMKCQECGSYNTCRTADPDPSKPPVPTDALNGEGEEDEEEFSLGDDDEDEDGDGWVTADDDEEEEEEEGASTEMDTDTNDGDAATNVCEKKNDNEKKSDKEKS